MEKRLYRSRKESMIAGVAGGLAEYFSIDPVLIRLLFVIAVLFHGTGVLAYIILWIVVPHREPEFATGTGAADPDSLAEGASPEGSVPSHGPVRMNTAESEARREKRSRLGAYLLIGLGVFFLADNLVPHFDLGDYWPVVLIAIGGGLLYNATKKKQETQP